MKLVAEEAKKILQIRTSFRQLELQNMLTMTMSIDLTYDKSLLNTDQHQL